MALVIARNLQHHYLSGVINNVMPEGIVSCLAINPSGLSRWRTESTLASYYNTISNVHLNHASNELNHNRRDLLDTLKPGRLLSITVNIQKKFSKQT